jgi:putative transposase
MGEQVTLGDLPHWYRPGFAHFVTYRLAGSIRPIILRQLREERERRLQARPPDGVDQNRHRDEIHKIMFDKYDRVLDTESRVRWLANESIASVVRENLYHHHGSKYELLAYTIMPNHVHLVLQPFESALLTGAVADAASVGNDDDSEIAFETPDSRSVLSGIMHSLKSYTANRANKTLNRSGKFWQKEPYDHWILDVDELERIVSYIAANPVRAGLCAEPRLWRSSSAYDRFQRDESRSALVGWLRDDWRR